MFLELLSERFPQTVADLMLVRDTLGATNGSSLSAGFGLKDDSICSDYKSTLLHLLFNLCQDCEALQDTMSCIPPSAFSAKRIRESQSKGTVATTSKTEQPNFKHFNTMVNDLNPLQYNSKMMNSVWGLYNRYSSHNVKKNNDVCFQSSQEVQQSAASSKGEAFITLPTKMNLDKVWGAFNFSQSH